MKSLQRISILMSVAMLTTPVYAQGDFDSYGTVAPKAVVSAWNQFKLNPKTRVELDFRNATVDAVLQMLSKASGIAIIKDPSLTGGITLQSPKPQSLEDALCMLSAVLDLKGFEIDKQGHFLMVKAKSAGFGGFGGGGNGFGNTDSTAGSTGRNALILRVYPIKYANASALAKVINDVYAQNAATANANAATAAGLTGAGNPNAGAAGATGGTGFGGGRFGRGGGANGRTPTIPTVKASADDYSNSLIVNATSTDQDSIAGIISQIDVQTDTPQQTKVFKLNYALATDVQPVVQNILGASVPLGRSTTAQSQARPLPQGGGGFGNFVRSLASNTQNNGSATADTRTNSLVVTTTNEIMARVATVLETLDKPETLQSTTYVYVMQNARADVVSNLLNQAFGNRTTNGPVGGALSTNALSQSTLASSSSSGAAPGLTTTTNRTANNNNQVTTSSNPNSLTNQASIIPARDANGNVINVRNLAGQVTLVPNIDTNSIIVVSLPEDRPLVEAILKQMDQLPEQVMIQTLIVEVTLDKTDAFGFEYGIGNQSAGLLGSITNPITGATSPTGGRLNGSGGTVNFGAFNSSGPGGLQYTLTAGQYQAVIQAVSTNSKFNVLRTPRIFTTNNATAQINISESLPYITSTTQDATIGITTNYAFLDIGIVLTVTPLITSNGTVTMDVTQTANDLQGFTNFNAPIVNQREAETTVSVKDGETVVLGGIISNTVNDTVNKIPVLGDIPVLGNLFRSVNKTKNKTELLVFMTPHVVKDADDARRLKEATEAEMGQETQQRLPTAAPIAATSPAATNTVPAANAPVAPPAGGSVTVSPTGTVTTTAPIVIPAPSVVIAPGTGGTVIVPGPPRP